MNPKLNKRVPLTCRSNPGATALPSENARFTKTSVRDQAVLLLSIADIAKTEITKDGLSALWFDDEGILPKFPTLSDPSVAGEYKWLTPRPESLNNLLSQHPSTGALPAKRARAVSIEYSPDFRAATTLRTMSPLSLQQEDPNISFVSPGISPLNRRLPTRKQSLRLSHKARKEHILASTSDEEVDLPRTVSCVSKKNKSLQHAVAKGMVVRKILRRKFSWKNYPQLEAFLIANREEYLRHSALNYTVQQKEYNNALTDRLLELATEHAYVFDEKEFSFVTVRDRIRCYFKSYVQSAKKRGILMGYAARKAGLLTEDDLEKSAEQTGRIITPS